MRRYVIGTLGATIAGFSSTVWAQDTRPAARIGGVQAVIPVAGYAPADPIYRGQAPTGTPMSPPAGGGTAAPATGQPPVFGTPMPIPQSVPNSGTPVPGTYSGPYPYGGPYNITAPGSYTLPALGQGGSSGMPETYAPPVANATALGLGGPRWWVTGEGLLWWTKGAYLPPLLTTSSPQFNGIIGTGDTQILLGGKQDGQFQPGFRVGLGLWLGCDHMWALDTSFFYLPKVTNTFTADSNQFPVLGRPFFNLNQNIPYAELIASPGLSTGGFLAQTQSTLWGGDVNLRRYLCGDQCSRIDLIAGFRYLSLDEGLTITENFARTPNSNTGIGVPAAASGFAMDSFQTQNRFYGGQVGFDWEVRRGRWFTDLKAKVALGEMDSTVNINGVQQVNMTNGTTSTAVGGLLALPGNIGTFTESKVAVVSDMSANLGYHITPRLRATIGYNLLYTSHVLRPGDQIDPGLDVTRIPNFPVPGVAPIGAIRPVPTFKGTDYWAPGD